MMRSLWLLMCFIGGILFGSGAGLLLVGSPNVLDSLAGMIVGVVLMYVGAVKSVEG